MSTAHFPALVDLCRQASERRVVGTDLHLQVRSSAECASLLATVESGSWGLSLQNDGKPVHDAARVTKGELLHVVVHGLVREQQVIVNNVGMLLRYLQGKFVAEKPAEFYLLHEDFASWEAATHSDVLAYARALRIVQLVIGLADVTRDSENAYKEIVLLATRKLIVPLTYDSAALGRIAADSAIDRFEEAISESLHRDARREIAKRVLIRFFEATPERERLAQILARVDEIYCAFVTDFDIYANAFTFDKVREEFERKKLDFVVKVHTASSDIMSKLLAIPVAQGLLASQMKNDAALHTVNLTLLIGSFVFAAVAIVFLVNQVMALSSVQKELAAEKDVLSQKSPASLERLNGMIVSLEKRLFFHKWMVPAVLAVLISVTTAATLAAFKSLP